MKIEGLRFGYEDLKNCKIFFEVLLILFKVLEGKGNILDIFIYEKICFVWNKKKILKINFNLLFI